MTRLVASSGTALAGPALASRMLDAMGADIMGMGMKGDSAWTALTDSVRRDLAEVPSLSGRAFETRSKVYIDRMRRLLGMHETMMHTVMKPE